MATYTGQRVGYLRVSSADQNITRQQLAIGGCDRTFTDRASGGTRDGREQLKEMLAYVREGDMVVVASMDRLARSLRDLEKIVRELVERGVLIHFVKEDLHFQPGRDDAYGMFQLHLMGAVAELERSLIRERQREGIEAAKRRGVYKGRKRSLSSEQIRDVRNRVLSGEPKARIAREMGIGRSTLYRYLETPKFDLRGS